MTHFFLAYELSVVKADLKLHKSSIFSKNLNQLLCGGDMKNSDEFACSILIAIAVSEVCCM